MIHHGDLFDVLPTLAAESIHACICDPPYGLGFMGKEWDTFAPDEVERRILTNRAIDSDNPNLAGRVRAPASSPSAIKYDRSLDGQRAFQAWTERWAREVWRVLTPGAYVLVCGAPRSYHRMTSGIEDAGFEIRDCVAWLFGQGFPKSLDVSKAIDQAAGAERAVVGYDKSTARPNRPFWPDNGATITAPATAAARAWHGWGTALKPAFEPIVVARKPPIGTVAANVLAHGTGALNVDACRIGTDLVGGGGGSIGYGGYDAYEPRPVVGRWPANVVLDEDAAEMLDAQTGDLGGGKFVEIKRERNKGWANNSPGPGVVAIDNYGDRGGASRFFYVAKPDRAERDRGLYGDVLKTNADISGRPPSAAGLKSPRAGALRTSGARNSHPTIKPVDLMRWLVRLVTPPGGTVLDPFAGSGTTAIACRYEGVAFVGVEREAEYHEIAERREADALPLFADLEPEDVEP